MSLNPSFLLLPKSLCYVSSVDWYWPLVCIADCKVSTGFSWTDYLICKVSLNHRTTTFIYQGGSNFLLRGPGHDVITSYIPFANEPAQGSLRLSRNKADFKYVAREPALCVRGASLSSQGRSARFLQPCFSFCPCDSCIGSGSRALSAHCCGAGNTAYMKSLVLRVVNQVLYPRWCSTDG